MAHIIVRVEFTPTTKDHVGSLCDKTGMTQVALFSRMVEWFAGEDRTTQSMVLGQYPIKDRREVGRMIMRRMIETTTKL